MGERPGLKVLSGDPAGHDRLTLEGECLLGGINVRGPKKALVNLEVRVHWKGHSVTADRRQLTWTRKRETLGSVRPSIGGVRTLPGVLSLFLGSTNCLRSSGSWFPWRLPPHASGWGSSSPER